MLPSGTKRTSEVLLRAEGGSLADTYWVPAMPV